jgi:hypothetical protein
MNEGKMLAKRQRSKQEAIDELNRELNVRIRCFPRWVEDGRVSPTDAQDRIDRLATAVTLLADAIEAELQTASTP